MSFAPRASLEVLRRTLEDDATVYRVDNEMTLPGGKTLRGTTYYQRTAPPAGCGDEQRHARRVLVEIVLGPAAVAAEREAVVALHHDARALAQPQRLEAAEQRACIYMHMST